MYLHYILTRIRKQKHKETMHSRSTIVRPAARSRQPQLLSIVYKRNQYRHNRVLRPSHSLQLIWRPQQLGASGEGICIPIPPQTGKAREKGTIGSAMSCYLSWCSTIWAPYGTNASPSGAQHPCRHYSPVHNTPCARSTATSILEQDSTKPLEFDLIFWNDYFLKWSIIYIGMHPHTLYIYICMRQVYSRSIVD